MKLLKEDKEGTVVFRHPVNNNGIAWCYPWEADEIEEKLNNELIVNDDGTVSVK